MVTKNGDEVGKPVVDDDEVAADDDDDDVADVIGDDMVVGVSNRHRIGPAKTLSKVIDTEVPPLANPIKGDTTACNRPEALMVMLTEWTEMSEPCKGEGIYHSGGGGVRGRGAGIKEEVV